MVDTFQIEMEKAIERVANMNGKKAEAVIYVLLAILTNYYFRAILKGRA